MKKHLILAPVIALILSSCGGGDGYTPSQQTFTVIWENYDGSILEKDTEVPRGSWPEYNGRTPHKRSDEQYSYTFSTWSPQLTSVYKDITYVAQYTYQLEKAKIVFDLDGGTTDHSTTPIYRSTISASDFFFDVTKPNYSFRGWQYNGELVFDRNGNKLSNPELQETMTFVASYEQNVYLNITKNIEEAGEVYGTGTYDYYSRVELYASPNEGYSFEGWYYKNVIISNQQTLVYTVDTTDVTLEARFSLNYYRLEIESVHPSLGQVAINDHYKVSADGANIKYKSDVMVTAQSSTQDYAFLGWYDEDGQLVSLSYVYNFKMPNHDYYLYAKWDAPSYMVTINKNYENAGTVTGAGMHEYSTTVTVSQTTNPGYTFDGWYIDGVKRGELEIYRFNMPLKNMTVSAEWDLITYNVTYTLNGGSNSSYNPKTYNVENDIDLYNPSRTGYTFDGWTLNGKKVISIGNGMTGDITLVANWSPIHYSISLNPNGGELEETVFETDYNQSYSLPTPTRLGYNFTGWRSNSGSVSLSGTWKYTNVTQLTAQWSIINYKITYELNGGTNSSNNPSSYNVNNSINFDNPTKIGYTFLGWYDSDDNLVTNIEVGSTGEITLTAHWNDGDRYVVELNPNGGDLENESIEVQYDHDYSLPEPYRKGYTFDGWFSESTKIASEDVWNYTNIASLEAHWSIINYAIVYELNGGRNASSNPSTYNVNSSITFANPTKTGYTFLGWYDSDDNLVTNIEVGSTGEITLTAHWNDGDRYVVELNPNGGDLENESIEVQYDHDYSLPEPYRKGYTFDGWFSESTKIASEDVWNYTNIASLEAHWSIINYAIVYELNGGRNASSNPSTYNVNSSITFANPTKTGYTFLGWYSDNKKISGIPAGSTGTLNVEARWLAKLNSLSVTSEDTSKGTVDIISGRGYSGESITVVATPIDDCVFKGWYNKSTKVSDKATYTFTMPANNYSLVARFFTKAEEEEDWNINHGVVPNLSDDGKTITYGLYPQTNVNDSLLVSALDALTTPESNGWYLYEGDYYAKVSAKPYGSLYEFDNGTVISNGTTYWFKCEPIVWNVLSNTNGEYYIASSVLLDAHCYYNSTTSRKIGLNTVYPNNYEYSDIRAWLNEDFYNSAFALGNEHIQTTIVFNNAKTTDSDSNNFDWWSTEDKVFLPSYQDYINSSYGFSTATGSTDTRYCRTTDWARARGASYYTSSGSYQYNGSYWTRSPYSGGSTLAWYVNDDGCLFTGYYSRVYYTGNSVRPAITIKIV